MHREGSQIFLDGIDFGCPNQAKHVISCLVEHKFSRYILGETFSSCSLESLNGGLCANVGDVCHVDKQPSF